MDVRHTKLAYYTNSWIASKREEASSEWHHHAIVEHVPLQTASAAATPPTPPQAVPPTASTATPTPPRPNLAMLNGGNLATPTETMIGAGGDLVKFAPSTYQRVVTPCHTPNTTRSSLVPTTMETRYQDRHCQQSPNQQQPPRQFNPSTTTTTSLDLIESTSSPVFTTTMVKLPKTALQVLLRVDNCH